MDIEEVASEIVDAIYHVHKELGPGLLESAYQFCLQHELMERGLSIEKEKPVPLSYKGQKLDCGYRLDLLVENKIIVELKSIESLQTIHTAQMLTYLKLMRLNLGFLVNFNVSNMKGNIKRIVYQLNY